MEAKFLNPQGAKIHPVLPNRDSVLNLFVNDYHSHLTHTPPHPSGQKHFLSTVNIII